MSLVLDRPAELSCAATADEVEVVTRREHFLALAGEWDGLFARAGHAHQVFQQHAVLRHWLVHYGAEAALRIVLVRRDGRLACIWPLVARRRLGLTTLAVMGAPIAQFADILRDETLGPGVIEAGWRAVKRLDADLLALRRLRADAALAALPALAGFAPSDPDAAPFADLARRVGADGPGAAYSPRERSNYRRRLRRLAERGELSFEAPPAGAIAATLARQAVAMKRAGLVRHGVAAPSVMDPRFADCFADLAGDPASGLSVAAVRSGGEAIGVDLSFDCRGASFGHVIATHPDHERGGLGQILIQHSFERALARGSAVFDLMAPADRYKRDHADGEVTVGDCLLPLSLKGRLAQAAGLGHLRPALKQAARRLPPALAQRLARWSTGAKG